MAGWVGKCNHRSPISLILTKVAEGSEHLVFLEDNQASVIKLTKPDIYGDTYYLKNGLVNQLSCCPIDYLIRLRYWHKVFGSAPEAIGITDKGQIVSRQKFISGDIPTQFEVDSFLSTAGLTPIKKNCWLWKKPYPELKHDIWIGDARDENFVKSDNGIVPIDLRMWMWTLE